MGMNDVSKKTISGLMQGFSHSFSGFVFSLNTASSFPNGNEDLGVTLHAISSDGDIIFLQQVEPFNESEVLAAFVKIAHWIKADACDSFIGLAKESGESGFYYPGKITNKELIK